MATTTIQSILAIPPIQDTIGDQIENEDLVRCQNVCREWREIFTPILWRRRMLKFPGEKEFFEGDVSQAMLSNLGSHFRRLCIQGIQSLEYIAPHCHNLSHLLVEDRRKDLVGKPGTTDEPAAPLQDEDMELASSSPQIELLDSQSCGGIEPGELVSIFSRHSPLSQSLRVLTFHCRGWQAGSTSLLLDLLLGLPHLTLLECRLGTSWLINHDDDLLRRSTFRLKTLRISCETADNVKDAGVVFPFWKQCPFLTSFDLSWVCERDTLNEFVEMFDIRDDNNKPIRPVQGISMPSTVPVEDWQLIRILQGCAGQQLKYLFVPTWPFGPVAFEVLLEAQYKDLSHLVMSDKSFTDTQPEAWIKRLLSAYPRLKQATEKARVAGASILHFHADDSLAMPMCSDGNCFVRQLFRERRW